MDPVDFHLEEYKSLRTESMAVFGQTQVLFRYTIVLVGAVFVWLLTEGIGVNDSGICLKLPDYILQGAIFIPFLVSALSGLMGRALGDRIGTFSEYLRRLEQLLGKQGYGLEPHMVSNRKKVKAAFTQAWVILSLGSGAIAVVVYFLVDDRGICATKSAALPMALPALV